MIPRYNQQISLTSFIRSFFVKPPEFPENYLFFNSGRGAIKWLLSLLKASEKKRLEVGMPCYSCYTVYQAVSESGNKAVLLDIDPVNFHPGPQLENEIGKLDVLLWINYFGFRYNKILKEIRDMFPDLVIIEDCSQVDLRDYLKIVHNQSLSDYSIFSFNFRKPITAGGGGLLIPGKRIESKLMHYLIEGYGKLASEKLGLKKIIHILIYNYSYNRLLYPVFDRLIAKRRSRDFHPEEPEVTPSYMNPALKRLFYVQYRDKMARQKAGNHTYRYFGSSHELADDYSYGSLSYYPVRLSSVSNNETFKNLDKFMLWDNLAEGYKFFDISISEKSHPETFGFLSGKIFLPAAFFNNHVNGYRGFPGIE